MEAAEANSRMDILTTKSNTATKCADSVAATSSATNICVIVEIVLRSGQP